MSGASEKSRILLKLGREAVGRRLATDLHAPDGTLLVPRGSILDEATVNRLLSQGITVVLIEPKVSSKARGQLDAMFHGQLDDPYMSALYSTAVELVERHNDG
ncbi:MAG TPA: hypothetical protein ENN09_00205 [Planctomycetes bacterium]|nr:hypothetical protein [Planctomycetota bacterium]